MPFCAVQEEFYVFVSFSVPEESLKELSQGLEEIGGSFVIKGLPHNSFRQLLQKTKHLKEIGILAPISIDPESFEYFKVDRVPTFVLKVEDSFEKYEGNVPLFDVLREFSKREGVGEVAKKLLRKGTSP